MGLRPHQEDRYELKHEMGVTVVSRAFKNRGRVDAQKTYVAFDLENPEVPGTDLLREDCDKECLDEMVEISSGFSPAKPVLLAQGAFFEENPDFEESYQELDANEVHWSNAYVQECDPQDSEPEADVEEDDAASCYSCNSEDADEPMVDDPEDYSVQWVENDDGAIPPWQWCQPDAEYDPDTWDC